MYFNFKSVTVSILTLIIVCFPLVGKSQEIQKIVSIVNDDIISGYDLQQRVLLTITMSGFRNNKKVRKQLRRQALRSLVNDALKLQEANKYNIEISESVMSNALSDLERRNKIAPGQIESVLNSKNVELDTLLYQIRSALSWNSLLGRRIAPRINISKEEIDSVREKLEANRGKNEYFLSEIFIPVDAQNREEAANKNAQNLINQIKKGARFGQVALQFSQGPSAAARGKVGWVLPEDLAPELAAQLVKMKAKAISNPIRTAEGYYILGVENIRKVLSFDPLDTSMHLTQFVVPRHVPNMSNSENTMLRYANSLSEFINGCQTIPQLSRELQASGTGILGRVRLGDMPKKFQAIVKDIPSGKASKPIVEKDNYLVFAVCAKNESKAQLGTDEEIHNKLKTKRVNNRANRYLKDLQQSATIEMR